MNIGNLGFTEILIILLILVLFFGAKRIPEIGSSIGKGLREFKNSLKGDDAATRLDEPRSSSEPIPPARTGDPKRLSD